MRAITITAARIAGIDSRVGSLKPGKDADILVCAAHHLSLDNRLRAVFVDGRRIR